MYRIYIKNLNEQVRWQLISSTPKSKLGELKSKRNTQNVAQKDSHRKHRLRDM